LAAYKPESLGSGWPKHTAAVAAARSSDSFTLIRPGMCRSDIFEKTWAQKYLLERLLFVPEPVYRQSNTKIAVQVSARVNLTTVALGESTVSEVFRR